MSILQLLLAAFLAAFSAQGTPRQQPREALDGVDPVALIDQGKELQGKEAFKVARVKFDYLFATAENKATFEKSPEKYEIQLNGICARMGGGPGNPSDYAVVDGKIYIFASDNCHKKFVAEPAKYLPKPAPAMPASAEDRRRAQVILDRVIAALGGASKLDAIKNYVETSTQVQKRPQGDVTSIITTMWRFPDAVRQQRAMSQGERSMTRTQLLTAEGAWAIGAGRVYAAPPEAREEAEREAWRQVVPLLRVRAASGFQAAALPGVTFDGVAVDRVRLKHGGVDITLAVDKSGLLRGYTFTGRNMDAEIGEYTILLSDFREVSGMRLPFSERALFNGAPEPFRTRTIDKIEVDAALDPALFAPPKPAGGL